MSREEEQVNPYDTPRVEAVLFSADGLTEPAYSDGMDLVFRSDFISPRVCLVTGRDVGKHVEAFKLPIFRFYLSNYKVIKLLYVSLITFCVLSRLFIESNEWSVNLPVFVLLSVHVVPVILRKKSNIDFYLIEHLRVNETKKVWKQMLMIFLSVAVFTYGMTSRNYLFTVIGLMMILTFVMMVQSNGLVKIRRGDRKYYRIGGVHSRFLAEYPTINSLDREVDAY